MDIELSEPKALPDSTSSASDPSWSASRHTPRYVSGSSITSHGTATSSSASTFRPTNTTSISRRSSPRPLDANVDRAEESLVRGIGTLALAAAIVNITIGGGIFRLPGNVAAPRGRGAARLPGVRRRHGAHRLLHCRRWKRCPLTGGPYAYVGAAFGPYAGFISGVLLWMIGTFAAAAVATLFAANVGRLVPALGGSAREGILVVVAMMFWSTVTCRASSSARAQLGRDRRETDALVLIAIGGLFFIRSENLEWTTTPAAADVARTSCS